MRPVALVASSVLAVWVSDLARSSGVSRRTIRVTATSGAIGMMFFGVVLAFTTTRAVDGDPGADVTALILRTAASGTLLTSALIALVLTLTAPMSTAIDNVLALVPVSPGAIRLGKLAPLLGASFLAAGALALPTVTLAWKLLPPPSAVLLTITLGIAAGLTQILVQCILQAATSALIACKLNPLVASTLSGAFVLGAALALHGREVISPRPPVLAAPSLHLEDAVLSISTSPSPWAWATLTGWAIVVAAVALLVSHLRLAAPASTSLPILRSVFSLAGRRSGPAVAKALLLLRAPQSFLGLLGMTLAFVAGALVPPTALPAPLGQTLVASAPAAAFTFILFGPGRSLAWSWVGTSATGRSGWWMVPTVTAHFATAVLAATPLLAVALIAGFVAPADLPEFFARASVLFAAALIAGSLIPVSQEQPLSGSIALVLATLVYLVTVQLTGRLTSIGNQAWAPVGTLAVGVGLALLAVLPLRNLRAT